MKKTTKKTVNNLSRRAALLSGVAALAGLSAAPIVFGQTANGKNKNADEQTLIKQAILDYVEGVYEVDPKRIERSVHPDLAKRGFYIKRGESAYSPAPMTFTELVELSKRYYAKNKPPQNAPKEIVVFDVLDQTASAKLTAAWGIDYMHLAKYEGKWMILNVLWQSPPKQTA